MEYNYTREFKQPVKIYTVRGYPIPYAPDGIRLEHLVVGFIFLAVFGVIALLGFVAKVTFIQSLFTNYWLILLVTIGVLVWTLFSLKWDNKNFIDYLIGRGLYVWHKRKRYEHEMFVPLYKEKVTYQTKRK